MYMFSTKPSARPTDQDTAHPDAPVGTPGIVAKWPGAPSSCPVSRSAQHRDLAVTVETERWERVRERGREGVRE